MKLAFLHEYPRDLDSRIRIHGFVEDLRPLYAEAAVVAVPLHVSAGTNIKALEAMAMERAMLSTPSGVNGLGLTHGKDVWIAEGAEAFSSNANRLLADTALRRNLAVKSGHSGHYPNEWQVAIRPKSAHAIAAFDTEPGYVFRKTTCEFCQTVFGGAHVARGVKRSLCRGARQIAAHPAQARSVQVAHRAALLLLLDAATKKSD